jgi:RNA polymerase sigma-70 factor (ECF subfamily)
MSARLFVVTSALVVDPSGVWSAPVPSLTYAAVPDISAPYDLATERELALSARAGDRDALGRLLERFGPQLYRSVLLPRLGNAMAAEQALADTYARVVEGIGRFEWRDKSFYAWLRTIALHVALDLLRAKKREVLVAADDIEREIARADDTDTDTDTVADEDERNVARKKLERALCAIHPRYADAIRMRIIDEMPREDVARALSVNVSTFDVLLHRAIAALRKAVSTTGLSPGEPS